MVSTLITWHLEMLSMIEDMMSPRFFLYVGKSVHCCQRLPPRPSCITATQPDFALSNRMIRQRFLIGAKQAQHSEAGKLRLAVYLLFFASSANFKNFPYTTTRHIVSGRAVVCCAPPRSAPSQLNIHIYEV